MRPSMQHARAWQWPAMALAAAVLLLMFTTPASAGGPTPVASSLPGMQWTVSFLNNAYKLHWKHDAANAKMDFAFQVQTNGWIGFGIGEPTSGSMGGADILIAYVDDNNPSNVVLQDRYATGKVTPVMDTQQDWQLNTAYPSTQTGGWTTIYASRALDTKETRHDRVIAPGSNRIIVAFGASDAFAMHTSANRLMTAVTFFGSQPFDYQNLVAGQPNLSTYTFEISNYTIPALSTVYAFQSFVIPDTVAHVVAIDILLHPASSDYVHHLVLHDCKNTSYFQTYLNAPGYPANRPVTSLVGNTECNSPIWAWAHGGEMLVMPPQAGIRLGSGGGMRFLIAEMHYNNPQLTPGIVDRTRFQFTVTTQLRTHDVGMLTIGDPIVAMQGSVLDRQDYEFVCSATCTRTFGKSLNVFASMLHMHNYGQMMWTTQKTDISLLGKNCNAGVRGKTEYFDFSNQITEPKCFTINPGDQLHTHCRYDSSALGTIKWGLGSGDEMCMHFLMYYPRVPVSMCGFGQYGGLRFDLCGVGFTGSSQGQTDGTTANYCFGGASACSATMQPSVGTCAVTPTVQSNATFLQPVCPATTTTSPLNSAAMSMSAMSPLSVVMAMTVMLATAMLATMMH